MVACFPAVTGCGVAVAVGLAWVEASGFSDVLLLVGVAVLATGAFGAGAVLATAAAAVASAVAAMPACVAGRFEGVSVAMVFVVDTASVGACGVAAVGAAAPAVAAAIVACACGAAAGGTADDAATTGAVTAGAAADWLAASAAAAIASGAVPPVGVAAAGIGVIATVTGITTATGVGVMTVVPCCVGSAAVVEALAKASPDVELDFELSAVDEEDFDREPGGVSLPVALLASDGDAAGGPGLPEVLLAGGVAG